VLTQSKAQFVERKRCINCGSSRLSVLSRGRFDDEPLRGFIDADPWGENPMPYLAGAEWVFVRCVECTQAFHARILDAQWNERRFSAWMSAEAIQQFKERSSRGFAGSFDDAKARVAHVLRLENLTRSIRGNEAVRLLDFGCGFGEFVVDCHRFQFQAVGVDRAAPRIKAGETKIYPSLTEIQDAGPFHAITLFEVLEHLDNPSAIVGELSRLMSPGGILVLETPDCTGVRGISTHTDYLLIHPLEHINAFTHHTLRSIAERHGFALIRRPVAHVTADRLRILKNEAKYWLRRENRSTQLYFRRASST
jgi:2-polyprenyl-3-methyl-5-hydroxy-6-metoxy-1,4-benzoquinol methylase